MSLQTLDIVIGMIIVYLTVSLICSSINELLSATLALRAGTLLNALNSLLGSNLAQQVLNHPAVPAAPNGGTKCPAYIEPTLFASALLDTVIPPQTAGTPAASPAPGAPSPQFAAAHAAITAPDALLAASPARNSLSAFLRTADGDYTALHDQVAAWFDAYMNRVSGAYKRRSQTIIAIIAVCVVSILNVDSYKIYKQLTNQPAFAAALTAKADAFVNSGPFTSTPASVGSAVDDVNAKIAAIPVPIGWHEDDKVNPWWQKVIGLLITAVAASLGAPFWFDALSNIANLRSVGAKPSS
jgi:hypothetical protein